MKQTSALLHPVAGACRAAAVWFAVLLAAGCMRADVQPVSAYTGPKVPHPDRILVYRFAVKPEEVKLDQGVSARLQQQVSDTPLSAQRLSVAEQASERLTSALVQQLRGQGLPAESASGPVPRRSGTTAIVQGQIVSIDEGNRTRRTLIGLGAGESRLGADAQVLYSTAGSPPRLIESFNAEANSGHKPGVAETMGIGAARGRLASAAGVGGGTHMLSETRNEGDTAEAERVGKELGSQIAQVFVK